MREPGLILYSTIRNIREHQSSEGPPLAIILRILPTMSPTHDGIHETQIAKKKHLDRENRPRCHISKGSRKLADSIKIQSNCGKPSRIRKQKSTQYKNIQILWKFVFQNSS